MPNEPDDSRPNLARALRTPAFLGNAFIAGLPLLACFFGGATEKWSEGIVLGWLGLLLLFDPPRFSLGVWLNGVVIGLLVLASFSFLPAHWFFQPLWRTALGNDFGIMLPDTLSPQPWVTLGCLPSFVAGLAWFYYICARELEMRDVRSQLRIFAGGVALLALLCIFLYTRHVAPPFWHNERGFGPFPNRNQTGDLFGITAIVLLALGQDDLRHRHIRFVLPLLGFAALVAALVLDFSRAGILLLVGGSVLWLAIMLFRKATPGRIALGVCTLLVLLTALLIFGGQTLERFHLRTGGPNGGFGISSDFRWAIFHDAWRMIQNSPWCGIGLGNFEPIFAISRVVSVADTRSLHPESDWFWVWSELGWPAVLLILIAIGIMIRRVFPLREGTNQRFRLAAIIAALLFALHGLVDVSAHRVGTAYAGIFLLGLALHRPPSFHRSRIVPILLRFVGFVLLVIGIGWVVAARSSFPLPGSLGVDVMQNAATIANRSRSFDEAINDTSRGLGWAPLDWRLYFVRALSEVGGKKPTSLAISDFRRARYLEPNGFEVPLAEGDFWLAQRRPVLALTAWREALRRAGKRRAEIYGQIFFDLPNATAAFSDELIQMGDDDPELLLAALRRVTPERFAQTFAPILKYHSDLRGFTSAEKTELFDLWAAHGNLDALAAAVTAHPDWRAASWKGLAKLDANRKDFQAAVELMQKYAPPPPLPAIDQQLSLEELQQRFVANPRDYAVGAALCEEELHAGKIDDALNMARHFTEQRDAPAYFHYFEAQAWAAKGNWERAWDAWSALRESK